MTRWTTEEWQVRFEEAYRRGSYLMLDALGVDTRQLPRFQGWGVDRIDGRR